MTRPSTLPGAVLIGALSGAAAATLILFLLPPAGDVEDGAATVAAEALAGRIAALEQENREQASLIAALSARPEGPSVERRDAEAPSREEFDALLARLEAMGAEGASFESPTTQGLEFAIADVLEQREEEAREEKRRKDAERREAQIVKQVDYWTDRLDLTAFQSEEMGRLMRERDAGRQEIIAAIDSGEMGKEEAGPVWVALDTTFDEGMGTLLTPVQLEDFTSSRRK
ncbi:MAG: hypothetical protein ACYTF3_06600 [Planctomycetota bacterium]|jgi:hypothetical protein